MEQATAEVWAPESLGERALVIRRKRDLSQGDVAHKARELGVRMDANAVSKIERGTRRATLIQGLALALVLRVNPNDLGIRLRDYPEARFLRDERTRDLLHAMGWSREPFDDLPILELVNA